MSSLSVQDPLTPPPLPPKKRSLAGIPSPMATSSPFNPFAAFNPSGWSNPPALPDLVLPTHSWMNETFDAVAQNHSSMMAMNGIFDRQVCCQLSFRINHRIPQRRSRRNVV